MPNLVPSWVRSRPGWAHLTRAWHHYEDEQGNHLAAGLTFYAFLAVFPLLLLAASVLGYLVHGHAGVQAHVLSSASNFLPNDLAASFTSGLAGARTTNGVVGLVGLLLTGLGWVGALRDCLRTLWQQPLSAGNFVTRRLRDTVTLATLGVVLAVSLALSTAIVGWAGTLAGHLLGSSSTAAGALLWALSLVLGAFVDVAAFGALFLRVGEHQKQWRQVLRGAVIAGVGFELLKSVVTVYLDRVLVHGDQVYGSALAGTFGLLIWINLVNRLVLFSAAWTST